MTFLLLLACVFVAAEASPSLNISRPATLSVLAPVLPYFLSSPGQSLINGFLNARQSCNVGESDCGDGCCPSGYEYIAHSVRHVDANSCVFSTDSTAIRQGAVRTERCAVAYRLDARTPAIHHVGLIAVAVCSSNPFVMWMFLTF